VTRGYPSEHGEYDLSRISFIGKEGTSAGYELSHSFPAISTAFDDPISCRARAFGPDAGAGSAVGPGRADLAVQALTLKAIGAVTRACWSRHWSRGWSPGPTASRTRTGCGTAGGPFVHRVRALCQVGRLPADVRLRPRPPARRGRLAVADLPLAKNALILSDADQGCYVDIDDTIRATHG
jgi:hypothetical protein